MPPQHRRLVYLWHYRAVSPKALCFSDFLFVGGTGGGGRAGADISLVWGAQLPVQV